MVTARSICPRARASLRPSMIGGVMASRTCLASLLSTFTNGTRRARCRVVARNPKRSLSAGWIEFAACDKTLAVGEQLLQRNGQRLCPRCRQQAALSAYEQGVA